jgi:hypothetical protein
MFENTWSLQIMSISCFRFFAMMWLRARSARSLHLLAPRQFLVQAQHTLDFAFLVRRQEQMKMRQVFPLLVVLDSF